MHNYNGSAQALAPPSLDTADYAPEQDGWEEFDPDEDEDNVDELDDEKGTVSGRRWRCSFSPTRAGLTRARWAMAAKACRMAPCDACGACDACGVCGVDGACGGLF